MNLFKKSLSINKKKIQNAHLNSFHFKVSSKLEY